MAEKAEAGYDAYEAFGRVVEHAGQIDPSQLQVVIWHYVMERELEVMLSKLTKRPPRLKGFAPKAQMLVAIWDAENERAAKLGEILDAFNDLRNRVAHGNTGFDSSHARLIAAYHQIDPAAEYTTQDYGYIVQAICAFVGDAMMPAELERIAAAIDNLAESFSAPRREGARF